MQTQPRTSSALELLMKQYLDCLVEINQPPQSENCSVVHCKILELTELLKGELMKQLFPTDPSSHPNIDMKLIQQSVELFSKFQTFCIEKKGLRGPLFDFVFNTLNREILVEYLTILKLSGEEQEREIPKVDGFVHQLYMNLVELWEEFRKSESERNWDYYQIFWIHMPTQTVHDDPLPCYLGDIEANGKLVHVFMDSQSGQVFFMLSFKSCKEFNSLFMAGVKEMTYSDEKYLIQLMKDFFQNFGFSIERQELYMPHILSCAKRFRVISGKPCVSPSQTDKETHEEVQKQRWNLMELTLEQLFLSMKSN